MLPLAEFESQAERVKPTEETKAERRHVIEGGGDKNKRPWLVIRTGRQ